MTEQGRKYDGGKLRYDLIPVLALEEVTRVITLGAEKYDPENWKRVPEGRRRYTAAAFRHIEAWRKGEITDEIGTHHIANAISNLMFILEKELRGWEDVEDSFDSPQLLSREGQLKLVEILNEAIIKEPLWYPDYGEWVEYDGSGQPVEDDVTVEVLLQCERDEQLWERLSLPASEWCWDVKGDAKIVAYKIVK